MAKHEAYPLRALETVREHAEADAEQRMASALTEREAATAARQLARARLSELREAEAARRGREHERLRACTAVELQRAVAYEGRRRAREGALAEALRVATQDERRAERAVLAASRALQQAAADRLVLERHRTRWDHGRAVEASRQTDEELDEMGARSASHGGTGAE